MATAAKRKNKLLVLGAHAALLSKGLRPTPVAVRQRIDVGSSGLPEFDVVEDGVGVVFVTHVAVGSSDEDLPRRIEVDFVC